MENQAFIPSLSFYALSMKIPDNLLCIFSAEIEEGVDGYTIRIPDHELEQGTVDPGATYRIGILEHGASPTKAPTPQPQEVGDPGRDRDHLEPPVEEGEQVDVEIESLGEQGDGIARVDRGFVVIVPDSDVGERLTVEITDVKPTVAFSEVVQRHHAIID